MQPLDFVAPRPGLEPGTCGLTVKSGRCSILISLSFLAFLLCQNSISGHVPGHAVAFLISMTTARPSKADMLTLMYHFMLLMDLCHITFCRRRASVPVIASVESYVCLHYCNSLYLGLLTHPRGRLVSLSVAL
jgi:hypothetical protein